MRYSRELFDMMEKYAKAVGIDKKLIDGTHGRIWGGSYAQIALCMVRECTIEAMMDAKDVWQQRLDESLTVQERKHVTVIDGYLILALPDCPAGGMRDCIRQVELDTSVCRKQVIWAEEGKGPEEIWRRIFKITVLGLPPSPELSRGANMPVLNERQKSLWDEFGKTGPGGAAAHILAGRLR
ncbi:MAG TPA: hypothetical protein VMJ66_13065 [Geobacteraceae bacterium]|nr:hypothetical protein [Geobacteraceae bacterium]